MRYESIEQLYEEKAHIIFRYLMKTGCPKEDAEDIMQATFSKAIEQMIHLSFDNPSAWLFQVATNAYYDLCRRNRAYPSLHVEQQFLERMQQETNDIETFILQKETKEEMSTYLQQMTPSYAHLLLLKYDVGLSYEEIALMLNRSVEYVRTNLYRARQQLKKRMEEER